jgi:predicted nucleotide-binding protein
MSNHGRVFISYARPDAFIAQALAAELKALGVETWIDYANLEIGEDWSQAIAEGLRSADGVVIIASEKSAKSDWVQREMRLAVRTEVPLLPVVVDDYAHLPADLSHIQAALIRTDTLESSVIKVAGEIRDWITRKPASKISEDFSNVFAQDLTDEIKKAGQTVSDAARHSVFVVHGHDDEALQSVKSYLAEIGVNQVILQDFEEPGDSLLRRFLKVAEEAAFAVVVLSPDDIGAALVHYDAPKGGQNALRYRARQNVVLELGFFLGKLKDFNKVFVLRKAHREPWPEFEMPSDLAGAIFKDLDQDGRWRSLLKTALVKNGIEIRDTAAAT